ncbi:hypothetical protein [Nocardioides deserti]|uniref:Uncharacterized protein n=1 Tax=Nocardioides deserti TaxID=1588644 RepID=A0ABR6U6Z3_9ACTN|nr:hypothetical protein [Nocardioides deserti]MBC2960199.1 hypothetical protein [Nocardioides deserti]GGO74631.1 hypothetical protein GCM10012276_23040 [Nocardioides deserti]
MLGPSRALVRLLLAPLVRILLAALVLPGALVLGAAPAVAAPLPVEPSWGKTAAPNAVLAKGCKKYVYRYRLTLPTDDWEVDLVIKDPRGDKIASAYLLSDSEETRGKRWFRVCGPSTKPGRFTIRAKVSSWDGWAEDERRLPNSHFRLRRR